MYQQSWSPCYNFPFELTTVAVLLLSLDVSGLICLLKSVNWTSEAEASSPLLKSSVVRSTLKRSHISRPVAVRSPLSWNKQRHQMWACWRLGSVGHAGTERTLCLQRSHGPQPPSVIRRYCPRSCFLLRGKKLPDLIEEFSGKLAKSGHFEYRYCLLQTPSSFSYVNCGRQTDLGFVWIPGLTGQMVSSWISLSWYLWALQLLIIMNVRAGVQTIPPFIPGYMKEKHVHGSAFH